MSFNLTSLHLFQVTIHHGANIIRGKSLRYVNGRLYCLWECKLKEWFPLEITSTLKELGYKGIIKIKYPQAFDSLDQLMIKNDIDAIALARITLQKNYKNVDIYVLHGFDHGNGVVLIEIEPIPEVIVTICGNALGGLVRVSHGGEVEYEVKNLVDKKHDIEPDVEVLKNVEVEMQYES